MRVLVALGQIHFLKRGGNEINASEKAMFLLSHREFQLPQLHILNKWGNSDNLSQKEFPKVKKLFLYKV